LDVTSKNYILPRRKKFKTRFQTNIKIFYSVPKMDIMHINSLLLLTVAFMAFDLEFIVIKQNPPKYSEVGYC
jgi:hypothetical protein